MKFEEYIKQLKSWPKEIPLEPQLKVHRQKLDKEIREQQDLVAGAVLVSIVEEGHGADTPKTGDLVFVHFSVSSTDNDVLYSTRSSEGGSGQPLAVRLEQACRPPRSWEIVLVGMRKGQRSVLKVRPDYSYSSPECKLQPPIGVLTDTPLVFDITLLSWLPASCVRHCCSDDHSYMWTLEEGEGWNTARPPCEVTLDLSIRLLAHDGVPLSGYQLYRSNPEEPLKATLGKGQLPEVVEEALSSMTTHERAVFIIPASLLAPPTAPCFPVPSLPPKAQQVEVEMKLVDIVQVRDITGTGDVLKKIITAGRGDFPIDCPLHDTTVQLHYKVRNVALAGESPGEWVYNTRGDTEDRAPVSVDTGCGELPQGLELSVPLMLAGEVALVTATPSHVYCDFASVPEGIDSSQSVEWEVELVDFQKQGHWETMDMSQRLQYESRLKDKANLVYKAGNHKHARAQYQRLLKLIQSTREIESDEQEEALNALKLAALSNLALCHMAAGEDDEAVKYCDKALEMEPDSAKLHFRRGRANCNKGNYEEAESDFTHAQELDPSLEKEVSREITMCRARAKQASVKQKKEFGSFFKRPAAA